MKIWVRITLTLLAVLAVSGLAWAIRWHALTTLHVDYDEDDYLRAGQEFSHLIKTGDWKGFLETNYRPEHPPLAKIMVGISIANLPEKDLTPDRLSTASPNNYLPRDLLKRGRIANAILGTLTVGLLALVDPLAGGLLAIHSFTVKYVSQIMLESLPAFLSLGAVLAYLQLRKEKKPQRLWLVLSGMLLGLTAASKYLYCVAGIAVLVDWVVQAFQTKQYKKEFLRILVWGLISVLFFFASDPYLWPAPITRLKESVLFHSVYSTTAQEVENAGYPIWQPFFWLFSTPRLWQADAFWVALDPLITVLAFFGIRRQWQKRPVIIYWLVVALVFLLIWPTKWPQYIVILTAPLCLTASEGTKSLIIDPIIRLFQRPPKTQKVPRSEFRKALPWLIPGVVFFLILTIIPLVYQFGVATTDFNSNSIRDGLNGGIWRAIWGGITGKIQPISSSLQSAANTVHFIGLRVFDGMFSNILSSGSLFYNLFWMLTSVLLQTILGMATALLLWQKGVIFKKGWQALFILPWAIPEMIGALMWFNVFAPTTGWLSLGVQKFGESFPFAALNGWTNSANLWFLVLLISGVWYGFPFMLLATSAGLKMLPDDVFEAAALDGARPWAVFRYILWPLLLPLILPAMIIRAIFAFNQFYLFQAFYSSGTTLTSLSYDLFHDGQYAVSAVVNVINIVILLVLVILLNRTNRVEEGVNYA
jgi:ABC-type sugar transport system permease subunit